MLLNLIKFAHLLIITFRWSHFLLPIYKNHKCKHCENTSKQDLKENRSNLICVKWDEGANEIFDIRRQDVDFLEYQEKFKLKKLSVRLERVNKVRSGLYRYLKPSTFDEYIHDSALPTRWCKKYTYLEL